MEQGEARPAVAPRRGGVRGFLVTVTHITTTKMTESALQRGYAPRPLVLTAYTSAETMLYRLVYPVVGVVRT